MTKGGRMLVDEDEYCIRIIEVSMLSSKKHQFHWLKKLVALVKLDSNNVSCEGAMKAAFNLCYGCDAVQT